MVVSTRIPLSKPCTMRIPVVLGTIDRRILVNYQVDPDVLEKILPDPFRPKRIRGKGIAGICLIRLKEIRPRFVPRILGISSENAAHRIAVEWSENGQLKEGVYVPRRDTSSRLNSILGGKLFPGTHHHARFDILEHDQVFRVAFQSDDGDAHLRVEASLAGSLPKGTIFKSLAEASDFFERGSLGYSATEIPGKFDGLELRTNAWQVQPLRVKRVESHFFEDRTHFPKGSVQFDCALLMRGMRHEWLGRDSLYGNCCT